MEWTIVRLGDYISIKSGLAYKGCYLGKGDNVLLGMGCVSFKDKFVMSGARPYEEDCDDRFCVYPGDLVLATRQQSDNLPILAMPAIVPDSFGNKRVIIGTNLYRVDNTSELDNRFIYLLMKCQHYVNYIAGVKSGTAVQMVTKKNVEDYKFLCPPKDVREKIVRTIWAYDSQIENNQKRIKLLEQMAENLYKEWFVRFRFPGYETAEFEGGVPKGWKIKRYCEEFNIVYGKGLPADKLTEEGYPVFGGNGQIGYYSQYLYKEPQVLISCRGAASGVINISKPYSFVTSNSLVCEVKEYTDSSFEYLSFALKQAKLTQYQTGSAQPQITIDNIKKLKIIIPSKKLVKEFSKQISVINNSILFLSKQVEVLITQRDLLLPRLMSGKLSI